MFSRKNIAMLVAEALGTAILTFSILAVTRSTIGIPYFVALATGLTMALIVATMGASSGAHVNPAVTLGLWSLRKIDTVKALLYIIAQFIGAVAAMKLYAYLVDRAVQGMTGPEFDWRVFIAEVLGTAVFTLGVGAAVYQNYEGGRRALTIGGSLGLGILLAGVASNGLLNPAVAMGVQSWNVAYVTGPVLGGFVGMNLYALLFAGERWNVLPTGSSKKTTTKVAKKPAAKRKR